MQGLTGMQGPNTDHFRSANRNPYWQFGPWVVQDHCDSPAKVHNMLPLGFFSKFKSKKILGPEATGFVLRLQKISFVLEVEKGRDKTVSFLDLNLALLPANDQSGSLLKSSKSKL